MQKSKMKKGLAFALAASMVVGSSLTAFAEDPVTSGTTKGTGTSEGHVTKEKMNVVLPTDTDGTAFAYKMDPERLIQETAAGKYEEGTVFPAQASDTGVYFLVGDKQYANTSKTLQAINKSSCNITLTVDVQAKTETTDIALATSSTVATGDDAPNLYLGLKVGDDTKTVSATKEIVKKVIPGNANNFETAVVDGGYVYREKADATTWKAMNISMTGAVSAKAIEDTTTAPEVTVTWSWAKTATGDGAEATDAVDYTVTPPTPPVTPAAPSLTDDDTTYKVTSAADVEVGVDLGEGDLKATGITSITYLSASQAVKTVDEANYAYADGKLTIKAAEVGTFVTSKQTTRTYTITFDDTDASTASFVLTK